MAKNTVCPKCGGMMPGDAPQGLCPACLMALALGNEPVEFSIESTGEPDRTTVHGDVTLPLKSDDPHDAPTIGHVTTSDSPTEPAREAAPSLGSVRYFGDYELISEIARGGMGVVYRARQVSLNRPVALKMILAGQLAGEDDIRRFQIEAEAAANLDHPGIVPIYEIGEHDGRHFFSMGFVEGTSLAAKVADGPLPPREAATLTMQVAEAIQYAHERDVIHRDLKPANVLLDRQGRPKVTDFGLAKKLQGDSSLTQTGQIMGTPSYMPPEQAEGKNVGPLADVYALGAILYCLLTGRPPFQAASPMDTLRQVLEREPVPPRQLNPSIPRDLETICLKCLEKEPGKRYGSAEALVRELNCFISGEPIRARPVGPAERSVKWMKRRPVIAGLMGLVALVTAMGISGVVWQWREAVLARAFTERETDRAKAQTKLAKSQTELATQRLEGAVKARAEERKQTVLAEQRLYDVRMNFVQRYWEDYDAQLFQQGLDEQHPHNQDGIDRRGFEWFYWRRKSSSGHITFKDHTDDVRGVAFSPDGKRIASAGADKTVKVWDADTGLEYLTFRGHNGTVMSVAFSPDGRRIASASSDKTVKVWDADNGQNVLTFNDDTAVVTSMAFSPDGRRIASAGNKTVKVWDADTGKEALTFTKHTKSVQSVAFSPDGSRIASAGYDSTVKVWDADTGLEYLTFRHSSSVIGVAFSRDGSRIASRSLDGMVKVWNASTGRQTLTFKDHTGNLRSFAFSPDGKRIAFAGVDKSVKVWDADTGQETLTLKGHTNVVWGIVFSPDSRRIASASSDKTVKVWDAVIGQETLTLKGHGIVRSVAFDPNGPRLAHAIDSETVQVLDLSTGREALTLKSRVGKYPIMAQPASGVNTVAFSPDGKRIASASDDMTVKVWDLATDREPLQLRGDTSILPGSVRSVAFSPDGRRIASAGDDKMVRVWDLSTGREALTLKGHTMPVSSVTFSRDGRRIASAGDDETVRVWDADNGREILTLKGHTGKVKSVTFSPDGRRLASASWDKTVRVWDASTVREPLTLKGHSSAVIGVAFSPDGKRVVSASYDTTVKVWNAVTGQETLTLKGHTDAVWSMAISSDGQRLASASRDGTLKIWDARPLDDESAKPVAGER